MNHLKPFRFGVMLSHLPVNGWIEQLRHIEALGYSTVFWSDHFRTQWDPVVALTAVAAVTEHLKVGSLVYCVDYRHPVVLAKTAATIHLISGGRHEFGIGAGWMKNDYDWAGLYYDRPSIRIERLEEAIKIIRSMWTQKRTRFLGKHYRIIDIPRAVELPEGEHPRIIVGGGGRKILTLAGRYADIVGIAPSFTEGQFTPHNIRDLSPDRLRKKVSWVRKAAKAAGRNPDDIELNSQIFGVTITDDPEPTIEAIAMRWGVTSDEVTRSALFLTGSASEIQELLEWRRNETGISYIVIPGSNPVTVEQFAKLVVKPLTQG